MFSLLIIFSLNFRKKLDVPHIRANLFNNQIEIKVTNHSKENNLLLPKRDVLINSPIKYQILKAGLEENTSFNILGRGGFGKVIRASYLGNYRYLYLKPLEISPWLFNKWERDQ